MKCLNPIVVSTRSKIISPLFGDRLKREHRCGKCANCQKTLQREWYYRAFYEYQSTVANNGYMLMDCLTYSDRYVPRMSRFYPDLPKKLDYMCFDYFDLRYFLVRLRDYLSKKGFEVKNTLRYFASSEYGTEKLRTHRPHIHILFYVTTPNLDNYTLSNAIAACWHYGRTDGIPYKSRRYVDEYTIRSGVVASQRACKYVSKYVMKDSYYQKVIDKRINKLLYYYYDTKFKYYSFGDWSFESVDYMYRKPKENVDWTTFESFLRSSTAKKLKTDIMRYMNQFHKQSLSFGLSAIDSMDIESIIQLNVVSIADSKSIVMRIGLPTYYRRKLFYHIEEINGLRSWQLNNDLIARRYKKKRDEDKFEMLVQQFELDKYQYQMNFDAKELANYVINKRYRHIDAIYDDELTLIEKYYSPGVFYNYSTRVDSAHFHGKFVTDTFLGSSSTDYIFNDRAKDIQVLSFDDYIKMNSYEDYHYEQLLQLLKEKKRSLNDSIQCNYDNIQRLNQVYKNLLL